MAVPVTGRSGAVVAALALSGPTLRFTAERVTEFAADLSRPAPGCPSAASTIRSARRLEAGHLKPGH